MTKLQKRQSSSATLVVLIAIMVVLLVVASWFVYKKHQAAKTSEASTSAAKSPLTNSNLALVSPTISYPKCIQSDGHGTTQIAYLHGTTTNTQNGILTICNIKSIYVANTVNKNITPLQLSVEGGTAPDDPALKAAIAATPTFQSAGCVTSGTIDNSDVKFTAYIAAHFAIVSPATSCPPAAGFSNLLYVYTAGNWKMVDDTNKDTHASFQCSVISQYKIPSLFILLGGTGYCAESNGKNKDLVSGLTY